MHRDLSVFVGHRFGRLEVLSAERRGKVRIRIYLLCLCACGNLRWTSLDNARRQHVTSCGCIRREVNAARHLRHGGAHKGRITTEYRTWQKMKARCTAATDAAYADYGGRGITVCDRWLASFENFLADMGEKPAIGFTLDRRNNDLGYCKDNCRWATIREQQNNRRDNHRITFNGRTMTLAEWARETTIKASAITSRLRRGWTVERALTVPMRLQTPYAVMSLE